jgi:adenosine deaminase
MIKEALEQLKVERIDHGVQCIQDDELRRDLARRKIPLTVCPLSNVKLRVFPDMESHPLLMLLKEGLNVTVNSDDPAYFGGYLTENFLAAYEALSFDEQQLRQLLDNAIRSSFLPPDHKKRLVDQVW